MIYNSLFGVYKEAVYVILKDALQRISVLQHLSPQYFCDNGSLLNGKLNNEILLPKISTKNMSVSEQGSVIKSNKDDTCSRMSSSTVEGATYGPCGRFERRMCQILDSIELARAEITGVKAIQLANGRIQYINEQQIKDRKSNEDLHTISSCLDQILEELETKGTYDILINYVSEKMEGIDKMEMSATSDKVSEAEIHAMEMKIENSQLEYKATLDELLALIRHLKHQKQELQQKNQMEYNFIKAKTDSDTEQLKLQSQSIENEIIEEMSNIHCLIKRENQVNSELSMFLRNSIQTMEQSIEYWINIHSKETSKFQGMVKSLKKKFQNLKTELETLATKYVTYEKVCIEDRIMKAEQAKQDEIEAFFNNKALMIQKWWRYICVMLSIGPHAPKKKGKKGKNKKK